MLVSTFEHFIDKEFTNQQKEEAWIFKIDKILVNDYSDKILVNDYSSNHFC